MAKPTKKPTRRTTTGGAAARTSVRKATKKGSKKGAKKAAKKPAKKAAKKPAKKGAKKPTKKAAKKGTKTAGTKRPSARRRGGTGRHLVVVESPAKAKTINKYLGSDFVVHASVGHVRDLPQRADKGDKRPVPGVDIEAGFRPTYVVLPGKAKTVASLKRLARGAEDVWFATDLDREGEAIAWHLTKVLEIDPLEAKRVVFNAITEGEVRRAFASPRAIDEDKVNAQQARRILDRIVGYQASPLLWKKVARGLSAGRVQSVAVRLVVEREREIQAFVPDESWRVIVRLCLDPSRADVLAEAWDKFLSVRDDKGKGQTLKAQNAWLSNNEALKAELFELEGKRFELGCKAARPRDLSERVREVSEAVGLLDVGITTTEDPQGKGPARSLRTVTGRIDPAVRYSVVSAETKRTTSRPPAPFITSSLQIAAANQLGFAAQRTMRTAQALYEGVALPGEGQVGLITYVRTDSTHVSPEAIDQVRNHIGSVHGKDYLPRAPNRYASSNKAAQEAHEAIRPTFVDRTPESVRSALRPDQHRLYRLIWERFIASQMTPAKWDATTVLFRRSDRDTKAVLRATGRTLAFDGFYRVIGAPTAAEEQMLPELGDRDELAPFSIVPEQRFSAPPPRYTEASLVKTLEADGIGRPSTYAQIISVIQERKYVEQIDRRFYATDLGGVVTDKLIEAFPAIMDAGYTRQMEAELDRIEEHEVDWVEMLERFYARFSRELESAHDLLTHAKAESQPAIYRCPRCGARTAYRFGKNGRFLSCTTYPTCDYSAPIDREGRPLLPERVDVVCPEDGSDMELRSGRFGRFLASVNYPRTSYVINLDKRGGIKHPSRPPLGTRLECPKCGSTLNLRRGKRGPWLGCSRFPKCRGRTAWNKLEKAEQERLEKALEAHEEQHPVPVVARRDGTPIPEGTPVHRLLLPGRILELEVHPDAEHDLEESA